MHWQIIIVSKDGKEVYRGLARECAKVVGRTTSAVHRGLYKNVKVNGYEVRWSGEQGKNKRKPKPKREPVVEYEPTQYEKLVFTLKKFGNAYITYNPCKYLPDLLEKEGLNCRYHEPKFEKPYKGYRKPKEEWIVEVV